MAATLLKKSLRSRELTTLEEKAELRDWETWASEAIHLKLVRSERDLINDATTFHPTYTHQLFDDEKIRGYRGLKIEIFFNASDLFTYFHIDFEARQENADDVVEKISGKMASGWTDNLVAFKKSLKKFEFKPLGEHVMDYQVFARLFDKESQESIKYEVYKSSFDTPGLRTFHERLQFFLLFYIESSSYIDSSDPIWQLLIIFERREVRDQVRHFIVGYTTLYKFFHYPDGFRLRLSQILILPPFQRCGHGQWLLKQVYSEARADPQYLEINIEDPSPGFQRLRDTLDLRLCVEHGFFQQAAVSRRKKIRPASLDQWDPHSVTVEQIKTTLKLPEIQIVRCYEMFKLAVTDREDEDSYREYRLEVKARLSRSHREELSIQNYDTTERKKRLNDLYEELIELYDAVLENLNDSE